MLEVSRRRAPSYRQPAPPSLIRAVLKFHLSFEIMFHFLLSSDAPAFSDGEQCLGHELLISPASLLSSPTARNLSSSIKYDFAIDFCSANLDIKSKI